MAADPARERELAEQLRHPRLVAREVRIHLARSPLEVCIGHGRGAAVSWADDPDRVEVACLDDAIRVRVDQVEARRRPPVAEQSRLGVLCAQWLPQERVGQQVDLADRQVVRGTPVGVDEPELVVVGVRRCTGCIP